MRDEKGYRRPSPDAPPPRTKRHGIADWISACCAIAALSIVTPAAAKMGAYSCFGATEFACSTEGCERLDGPPNDIEIDLDKGRMLLCLYSFCDTAPVEVFALGGGMYAVQAALDLPEDSGGGQMPVIVSIDAERGQYTLVRGAGGDVAYTIVGRCSEAE